jgi:hypothetical protein
MQLLKSPQKEVRLINLSDEILTIIFKKLVGSLLLVMKKIRKKRKNEYDHLKNHIKLIIQKYIYTIN